MHYFSQLHRQASAVAAFIAVCIMLGVSACRDTRNPSSSSGFDRTTMLQEVSTNLIIPSYRETQMAVSRLQTSIQAFTQSPSVSTLQTAQSAWLEAYRAFLRSSPYDFGPAESAFGTLRENIGVFPANPQLTEQYINEARFDLNNFNRSTRGFHGMEYLLFAASAQETVTRFSAEAGANRRQYLTAITNDLKTRIDAVANAWLSGGYQTQFTNNNGTSIGSSTSMLFNEFVKSFEEAKNFKVALPLGRRPGQTTALPQHVEGLYSAQSLDFLKIHLATIENIWHGRTAASGGKDFTGFEEYLATVAGGQELIANTKAQLAAVNAALNAVPTSKPLADLIRENHPSLTTLNTELQKQTRFFKSDMSSLLGITITYSSGDGD
jgi:predicted lipoprotein